MKKTIFFLVLTVFALATTTAFAQVKSILRADVPMAFSVDGEHYGAGPYQLRIINNSVGQLFNMNTGRAGLFMLLSPEQTNLGSKPAAPALRFIVNGKRAYLTSLSDGEGNAWHVHVAEKDLEASRGSESKTNVVALK